MALPATATALRAWLVDVELSTVADDLVWTSSSAPVVAAVDEVELLLGHTIAVEGATLKMLTLARWQAWRQAVAALVTAFDLKAGTSDLKLSQKYAHAKEMLYQWASAASAYSEGASALGSGAEVGVTTIVGAGNPYGWDEWA